MITFAPVHRPFDEIASESKQSDLSVESATYEESITTTQTNMNITGRTEASENYTLQIPPRNGQ